MTCVALFTICSLLCGLAGNVFLLVVFRAIQGIGAAMIASATRVLAMDAMAEGSEGKANGLNHFGFHVENSDVIAERLKDWDVVGPSERPADRVYAEQRATDPEGNMYDIAEGGFDRDLAIPKKTKKPAPVA